MANIPGECFVCNGLMGPPLQYPDTAHRLCEWLRPGDLAALAPWFSGNLTRAELGSE